MRKLVFLSAVNHDGYIRVKHILSEHNNNNNREFVECFERLEAFLQLQRKICNMQQQMLKKIYKGEMLKIKKYTRVRC